MRLFGRSAWRTLSGPSVTLVVMLACCAAHAQMPPEQDGQASTNATRAGDYEAVGLTEAAGEFEAALPGNWSGSVRITSINVSNINALGVWLTFTPLPYEGLPCSTPNTKGNYWLGGGPENVREMTSVATAALVNSRRVSVYWRGECLAGYPVLLGITLK